MPAISKKQPNCPYGNPAKYICVNSQCRKPGLICQKGQHSQSQCWLFHQNCTKVKWSQIQVFGKENLLAKSPEFLHVQDKIENIFLKALEKIQAEHEKFRIWAKTYGHSLETMKFIKVLMDRNYEQLTGDYMATMMPFLSAKQPKRIETPIVIQSQVQAVKGEIDRVLEKISTLYLKAKKLQKPSIYSANSTSINSSEGENNVQSYGQTSNTYSQGLTHTHTSYKEHLTTPKEYVPLSSTYTSPKDYSREYSNQSVSSSNNSQPQQPVQQFNPDVKSTEFKSKILDNLSVIEPHFEGRVIKSAKLIFRASEHNFSIKKFHELCDNIPETLTLIHNEFGKKFGGYTPVAWTSDKKHWVADKSLKSFIFSVDMGEKFKLNLAQFAIASNPERGPTFGCCDICIVDSSNKEKSNCQFPISYNNNGKYVRSQNTSTLFTGNPKGQFYVKEWQVYKLEFEA